MEDNTRETIGLLVDFEERGQVDLLNGQLQLACDGDELQVYHIFSTTKSS